MRNDTSQLPVAPRRLRSVDCRATLALVGALACGPKVESLHAVAAEECTAEYRLSAELSGNVLGVTLAKDNAAPAEDEIITVLTYKQSPNDPTLFELIPSLDPADPGELTDPPPALTAKVSGHQACLAPMGPEDSVSNECVKVWLGSERCYELGME
jgi:hypothetical protein